MAKVTQSVFVLSKALFHHHMDQHHNHSNTTNRFLHSNVEDVLESDAKVQYRLQEGSTCTHTSTSSNNKSNNRLHGN